MALQLLCSRRLILYHLFGKLNIPVAKTMIRKHNWVKRLCQKSCMDLPASTGRSHSAPESQEVVRVDFHDTGMLSYEQPLDMLPTSGERNSISVTEPMKLFVGSFLLTIPNGTDPQRLDQTLRIMKELKC